MVSLRRFCLFATSAVLVVFTRSSDASRSLRSSTGDDQLVEGSFDRPPPPEFDGPLDREGSADDDSDDGSLDIGSRPNRRWRFFHGPDEGRSYEWRGSDEHSGSDDGHFLPRHGDYSRPYDDRDGSLDDGSDESSSDGHFARPRGPPRDGHPDDLVDENN